MKDWPIFAEVQNGSHYRGMAEVQCFNCRDWSHVWPEVSGYAKGSGRYVSVCRSCKLRTFYDLANELLRVNA